MITNKDLTIRIKQLESFLLDQYKESRQEKKRDWRTYEQQLAYRIREAFKDLKPLIRKAAGGIIAYRERGRKPNQNRIYCIRL